MPFRRAKIVATLGPASNSPEMIDRLIRAGMDVARLNFSHGTHEDHARAISAIRDASGRHQKPIAILADLQGPKIRTGVLDGGNPVRLRDSLPFILTTRKVLGTAGRVSTDYRNLPRDVRPGQRILLDDGKIELRVVAVRGPDIHCRIVHGGLLSEHKGINIPGATLRVSSVTAKDRTDLAFALAHGVNYVAISFVRTAADVTAAKSAIRRSGRIVPVIAKLEKPEALDNLDSILSAADGVMVARGDLGVEMSPEKVPLAQKRIIERARAFLLPVITATQMLESMTHSPRPTRAEASDVANAVLDGTDAVMLSGETAVGEYPVESVAMMDRIVREAETTPSQFVRRRRETETSVPEAISEAICHAALVLNMKIIAVFTESGSTARLVSKYRPATPLVAFSPNQETRRRLSLLWGVIPRSIGKLRDIDALTRIAEARLLEEKLVRRGDIVGIVAGTPLGTRGATNLIKIHSIAK